jgi:RimJ/RimL family protein N-acetyltransferase/catechol 2,3-dioxygenase-like lactoylglutathione lyase family enzyme
MVTFRLLTAADLPLLHRWLHEPHVTRWWGDDAEPTFEEVEAKYLLRIGEETLSEQWLIEVDGAPVGWIQCYDLADWPATAAAYGVEGRGTAGVDLLIGSIDRIGRGLGPAALRAFAVEVVFGRHPDWHTVAGAPHRDNRRSRRAFEKAGFHFVRDVVEDGEPGLLYAADRTIGAVSTAADDPDREPVVDIGLTHVALPSTDIDASIAFYARYADMGVVHRRVDPATGDTVVWLSDRTRPFVIVLIQHERVSHALGGFAHLGVGCRTREEVDRRLDAARAEGREVLGPLDLGPPVGYFGIIPDPDGHNLEVSYGQEVGLTVEGKARVP